jgi:hypothetical protein
MKRSRRESVKWYAFSVLFIVACLLTARVRANDWPQFRYDAGRTAASPDELPTDLQIRWTRTFPAPRPAFPHEVRLGYDTSYEPVVLDGTMFVPSMVTDCVTALDTETGDQRWRFMAEGPVRFAPVAWEGKVYFVSDDGYLYCLNAADGSLRWKFRGLPEGQRDRKVLGHGRLISLFAARGGPVLADGVVYFAAGLWPTEGVFVHAVDAESGAAVWSNTEVDRIPDSNWDHGVGFVSGLTPQGYLAIVGDRLVVPCGMQLPAFLDLKTGELQTYTMGWGGRLGLPKGGWFVAGIDKFSATAAICTTSPVPATNGLPTRYPTRRTTSRCCTRAAGPGWRSNGPINGNSTRSASRCSRPKRSTRATGGSSPAICRRSRSERELLTTSRRTA